MSESSLSDAGVVHGVCDVRGVRALLLDMDGTLVDSHRTVERAWRAWA